MTITFTSCFYIIKSKFDPSQYIEWMNHFISIANHFNLVIYTDQHSIKYIDTQNIQHKSNILLVIKPIEHFYNYQYKEHWISNHETNYLLNDKSSWELNMLWAEKIFFVKETIERRHFQTEFYGWCDIGYFRNRPNDTHTSNLMNWPNPDKIRELNKHKIIYACVNNDNNYLDGLMKTIRDKNDMGLPNHPIPPFQTSIAGGFFILHKDMINWWFTAFDEKLKLYFTNNYLVKDDQIILADCIFSYSNNFTLFRENNPRFDNWFMFQRIFK